jgi:hypothetical protein
VGAAYMPSSNENALFARNNDDVIERERERERKKQNKIYIRKLEISQIEVYITERMQH